MCLAFNDQISLPPRGFEKRLKDLHNGFKE